MGDTVEHIDKIELPKLIHFIWAGGTHRPDYEEYKTIFQWAEKNPDFKINLWVDEKTDLGARKKYNADLRKYYKEYLMEQGVINKDVERLFSQILVEDISENSYGINFRDDFIAYEIDKLTPNYGSSSDLLRYAILYYCGGRYGDLDVETGKNRLSDMAEYSQTPLKKHVLYIEHCTQNAHPEQNSLANFETDDIGNDSFISTKSNPLMYRLWQDAKQNYDVSTNDRQRIRFAFEGKDIKWGTINRTGPTVVTNIIDKGDKSSNSIRFQDGEVKRLRDGTNEFSRPRDLNDCNWLKVGVSKCTNIKEALDRVFNTMKFEFAHANVIRLDDHIFDVATSCGIPQENIVIKVVPEILKRCALLKPNNETLLQATGLYHGYSDFTKGYQTIFKLEKSNLIIALNTLLFPDYLAPGKVESLKGTMSENIHVARFIKDVGKYVEYLSTRLPIIESLLRNINKFNDTAIDDARNEINRLLKSYDKFMKTSEAILKNNQLFEPHLKKFQEMNVTINKLQALLENKETLNIRKVSDTPRFS